MKKLNFLIASVLMVLFAFRNEKIKKFTPPGTVEINDTLYADVTEVTNQSWHEYENWVKTTYGKFSPQHLAIIPDSTVWLYGGMTSNQPWQSSYNSPGSFYNDYPVAGVRYDQAQAFCKWRTERVKNYLSDVKKFGTPDFEYRLPTPSEWMLICGEGSELQTEKNYTKVVKNEPDIKVYEHHFAANCLATDTLKFCSHSMRVASYKKNSLGLYDIFGNLAEMTTVKGICKGGSWNHSLEDSKAENNITYSGAKPWLGFRCICIVKKSKQLD